MDKVNMDKNTRIVVVNSHNRDIDVIEDSVAEVLLVPVDLIESSSSLFSADHIDHLQGIVKLANRMVILLHMNQVMAEKEPVKTG
jgi:purine-binding chemotaxis protein CheW